MEDLLPASCPMKGNRCDDDDDDGGGGGDDDNDDDDDDGRRVAELVQFSLTHVLQDLLRLYHDTFFSSEARKLETDNVHDVIKSLTTGP